MHDDETMVPGMPGHPIGSPRPHAEESLGSASPDPDGASSAAGPEQKPPQHEAVTTQPSHAPEGSAPGLTDTIIGHYRPLQRIGVGGMGEVYEAQQLEPIRRRVALKVIKRGMDTDAIVARFESERQALALMDHECIAKVFDAGATPDGRPYFVMEYVKGIPITEYCDKHKVGTKARLELFLHVCAGVQHAHQKGIIHRDLKPSNVLVTVQEDKAVPKIIDFGLAKATAHALTESTLFTELGQMVGTPEYMSPEQAEMSGLDIDTRTDVYSLGVLLYELLVGTLPFDPRVWRQGNYEDIRRKIREEEHQRPSTRLTMMASSTDAARRPRAEMVALSKTLRGDLDWIVMTAMEKDRTRRYDSASDLAADIVRHLKNEPVLAGPPSHRYRMQKFVMRHKFGVAAASAIILAVILGMVGTTMGLLRARRAQRLASEEAATARQISDFLVGLFKVADPESTLGSTITAREILDQGAARIERELENQPATQARLLYTMGNVYKNLGLYRQARPLLETSYRLRRGGEDLDFASSLTSLGDLARLQGNLAVAESLLVQAVETKEKLLGPEAPELASTLTDLGVAYTSHGKYKEAEVVLQRSPDIRERTLGSQHPDVAESLNYLGVLYWRQQRWADAEPLFLRAIDVWKKTRGESHPDLARTLNNLGILYNAQARYAEAVPVYEQALVIYEKSLGPEHTRTAGALSNLARVLYNLGLEGSPGKLAEAGLVYARALAILEKQLGPDHPSVATMLNNMANLKMKQKDYPGAEPLFRRALEIRERALGPDHPDVAWSVADLGALYRERGNYAAAEPLLRRALATFESLDESEGVAWSLTDLAILFTKTHDYSNAETYFKRAVPIFESALGPSHPDLAECLDHYSDMLRESKRDAEADAIKLRAQEIRASRRTS